MAAVTLYHLLKNIPQRVKMSIGWFALIASLSQIAILHLVNKTLKHLTPEPPGFGHISIFLVAMLLYVVSVNRVRRQSIVCIETLAANFLIQSLELLRSVEFESVEHLDKATLNYIMTVDTRRISRLAEPLPDMLDAAIITIGCLAYLLWVSLTAFAVTIVTIVGSYILYALYYAEIRARLLSSRTYERKMYRAVTQFLTGFQDLKLDARKMEGFLKHELKRAIRQYRTVKTASRYMFGRSAMLANLVEYLRFAPVIFLLPFLMHVSDTIIPQIVTVMFFMPLGRLRQAIPVLMQANMSVKRLTRLTQQLKELAPEASLLQSEPRIRQFQRINFQGVSFGYTDKKGNPGFSIGPIDFTLNAGEIVFMTGKNGSGKTTWMKVMMGLYRPWSGSIDIDGVPVRMAQHRQLFSEVFADFHVFRTLYGARDTDPEQVSRLLDQMGLTPKIHYQDGQFHTQGVSCGEWKRLALIVSLLDNRPIMVFDEWAAGEDPEFREYFYLTLLPELRRQGKTIFAITHDDRFFHIADRIIKMENGRVINLS